MQTSGVLLEEEEADAAAAAAAALSGEVECLGQALQSVKGSSSELARKHARIGRHGGSVEQVFIVRCMQRKQQVDGGSHSAWFTSEASS